MRFTAFYGTPTSRRGGGLGLTRRALLGGALATALAAACGTDDREDGGDTTAGGNGVVGNGAATQQAAAGAFPVAIEHQYGTTRITKAPSRVLSLGYTDHDVLLALGIVPVGVQKWFPALTRGVGPWAEPLLGSTTPAIFEGAEIDIEKAAALRPDLIVTIQRNVTREIYDRLAAFAPAVTQPAGPPPFGVPWRQQATMIGRAVGQERRVAELVAAAEGTIAAAKAANPQFSGQRVTAILPGPDGNFFVYQKDDPRIQFLQGLGFTLAPAVDGLAPGAFYATISRERLHLLESDLLVVLISSPEQAEAVRQDPVLHLLNVVQRGRMLIVEDASIVQAFSTNTVLSIPYAVDSFVPLLTAAISA